MLRNARKSRRNEKIIRPLRIKSVLNRRTMVAYLPAPRIWCEATYWFTFTGILLRLGNDRYQLVTFCECVAAWVLFMSRSVLFHDFQRHPAKSRIWTKIDDFALISKCRSLFSFQNQNSSVSKEAKSQNRRFNQTRSPFYSPSVRGQRFESGAPQVACQTRITGNTRFRPGKAGGLGRPGPWLQAIPHGYGLATPFAAQLFKGGNTFCIRLGIEHR